MASGRKLAQQRVNSTDATAIRTVTDRDDRFIVDWINVCNVSEAPATFRIFDASSGDDLDRATALAWSAEVPVGATEMVPGPFYFRDEGQRLAVRSSVANAFTYTVYGEIME